LRESVAPVKAQVQPIMPRVSQSDAQVLLQALEELLQLDSNRTDSLALQTVRQRLTLRLKQSRTHCKSLSQNQKNHLPFNAKKRDQVTD
jgi:ElaB/YqjD/DUF883 family membrane-anchored ribosome-binding protein